MIFPKPTDLPHTITLFHLLSTIDADQIEQALVEQIKQLIDKKSFTAISSTTATRLPGRPGYK